MSKQSDQHTDLINRLQEMQKDQQVISSITMAFAKVLDKKHLDLVLNQSFKNEFLFNDLSILTANNDEQYIFYSSVTSGKNDYYLNSPDIYFEQCMQSSEPVIFYLNDFSEKKTLPSYFMSAKKLGMHTAIGFCLPPVGNHKNVIFLFYKNSTEFNDRLERILRGVSTQLSITIRNISFSEKLDMPDISVSDSQKDTDPVKKEKINKKGFNGIIGESEIMQQIYQQITRIAPSQSNVIIYGETGTGKELIAQAIHDLSSLAHRPMIRINCAAIPANLIESELFGHEKGSFTGATAQRKGKFEQADNSTIFLDEIGELPFSLQGRLLRVLQEKQIERIGGNKTIKVNVRIVAATNRVLEKEVAEGRFRLDLYHRLNVFPIHLSALRDRKEDIPLLADYFLEKLNLKTGKKINGFSQKVMNAMSKNPWPGNIRELENTIERSILTAKDNMIRTIDIPKAFNAKDTDQDFQIKTLQQVEKEHILQIVEKCNGRIFGPQGAALLLGLRPTTLISKMQKLGIKKEYYFKK
ncbi:sigma-54 interaction domain-containing protein [Chryseobacterium tongliaoense]|uniref:sigma-54 interaction domain-containing protein n=1 Tax=Chryseobacterium tongliaoense TaxID=3240933 RepID=UPI003518A02C